MLRIFVIVFIMVFVSGCADKEEERKQEQKGSDELMRKYMNQKYDHRSLEQRIKDSQEKEKQGAQ